LKKDLKSELEAAISSTYMHQNAGTCLSIKVGHTGMDTRKLLANVEKSIPTVTRKLYAVNKRRKNGEKHKVTVKESTKTDEEKLEEREDAWDNIQSLGIKTHSSVCLPIWSCALNDRWVAATPTATASSSKEHAIPNDLPGQSQIVKSITKDKGEEDDDTMSEEESSEEENRLSKKLAKSSLKGPVNVAKRPGEELPADSRRQKKRKADHSAEDHSTSANVPTKKSKKTLADSVSSSSHAGPSKRKEHATVAPADPPSSLPEKGVEKTKKSDRAKAVDFMEDDTPPTKESQKPKKKEHALPVSSPFAAADAALKAHKKDKKRDKAPAATADPPALPSAKSLTSAPLAGVDAGAKAHKKDKKREKVTAEVSTGVGATNGTAPTSMKALSKPTSKPSETASPISPLKSALKKSSPPDSSLTPSELSEKKAKKATFSVVEKKKEKLGKGVIGGTSGGKSGKGGKSKISLVGRGRRM
jgi:ribosome biogenesis protein UTP30